jgi:hypothetical protein
MRSAIRRVTTVAASLAAVALAAVLAAPAAARERPALDVHDPSKLEPRFSWGAHDYGVRCDGRTLRLEVSGAPRWRVRIDRRRYRRGSFTQAVHAAANEAHVVTLRRRNGDRRRYHLRCLPADFQRWRFDVERRGPAPRLFGIQLAPRYAAIFTRDGAPVWWYRASGFPNNVHVLEDGTVAFNPVDEEAMQTGDYEIHRLNGSLVRTIHGGNGLKADIHELILLPNGNYLTGAQTTEPLDASPHGGPVDATQTGFEIQELTPGGDLVWSWRSRDHILPVETPDRWWEQPILGGEPYDTMHWNAVEPAGRYMYLSFRHLDAIYKIDRRTGEIVWKLGGVETPQSLEVRGDPDYPFGGQHDVRIEPNGTITLFDNRTFLDGPPRAVRYRIDEKAGTARLVESVTDPEVGASICCGSARRFGSGSWLIGWGGQRPGVVGAYDERGRPLFRMRTPGHFSYRAMPVPKGSVTLADLRRGMDAMAER